MGDALQHFPDWPAVGGVMYVNKNEERRWPCRSAAVPHSGSASSDRLMGTTRHNAGGARPPLHDAIMQKAKTLTLRYCSECMYINRTASHPKPEPTNPCIIFFGSFSLPPTTTQFCDVATDPTTITWHMSYATHKGWNRPFHFDLASLHLLYVKEWRGESYDTNKSLIRLAGGVCAHYAITLKPHFSGRVIQK
jgi:hypothetical protein